MTQPDFPLELKTLIIRELSPYASRSNPRSTPVSEDEKAAYFRDLCTVCLVWPDTIAIIRKILFNTISLRSNDRHIDSSLRNLCQALENDPSLSTFVKTLEFSHRNTVSLWAQNSPFIPTASRPLFLSFISFIPKMHKLRYLRLDNMHFHDDTSIEINDLRILKESLVMHLTFTNSTFSIPALNAFLGYWESTELAAVCFDGISLVPHYTADQMLLKLEDTWDWDEEDTWTQWEVDKPRTADFLNCGMLMLMDFLASDEWSPLEDVHILEIFSEDAMTATTCIGNVRLTLDKCFAPIEPEQDLFKWYVKSLAAVPLDSRLRSSTWNLKCSKDLGSQGVWVGKLDAVLSGENLQLKTLIIDVDLKPSPNGARTPELAQLQTWLMEICFPKVTARYFRCNKEEVETEGSGRKKSELKLQWIGDKQVDPKKH
ncbi:hypothetical protein BDZ89DRAFT_1061312 [Hymenopellis radicata]|nr:hypothetical protein BDZ89DRAFT_1061312 [Hymenopellis radicata]